MTSPRRRVCVITEIPPPYRTPVYERLAARDDLDLEVLFCAAEEPDRPWGADASLARVPHRVLAGWAPTLRARRNTFVYEINPGIVSALQRGRYDVVVVGGYSVFAEQAAIVWARLTRTPYVLHSESHLLKVRASGLRKAKDLVLPRIVGTAAAGMAVGSLAAEYLAHYGLPRNRIRIVPNTVDVAGYAERAAAARARADEIRTRRGLPERFLVFAGRLVEAKGLTDLLAALRSLGDAAPTVLVAGDGPLRAELDAAPHVVTLGFQSRDALIELWALADAAVVPSRDEPWGVVVNEALACGCPVVATEAVGAAHDLILDGENGRVVRTGDVASLADALRGPFPQPTGPQPIDRWDYDLAETQFVEAVALAAGRP